MSTVGASDGQRLFQRRNGGDAGGSWGRIHNFGALRAIRAIEASGARAQGVVASHGRREIAILPEGMEAEVLEPEVSVHFHPPRERPPTEGPDPTGPVRASTAGIRVKAGGD